MGVVDVLCYRDYTREGRRVNSHSLYVKGIKLTKMSSTGVYMHAHAFVFGVSIIHIIIVPLRYMKSKK